MIDFKVLGCGLWLVLAATLLAGCGDDDAADTCVRDDDCRGARVCIEAICEDEDEAGADGKLPEQKPGEDGKPTDGVKPGDDEKPDDTETPDSLGSVCGNDTKEAGEPCDGSDLGLLTCLSLGAVSGDLRCEDCSLVKDSCSYTAEAGSNTCGDGVKEPGEGCDGDDLGGLTCSEFGYPFGELACEDACQFDLKGCRVEEDAKGANCGNGQLDPGESCDGSVGVTTCTELGFASGALTCNPEYCYLDTSRCR